MKEIRNIVLLGTGNVGTHLAKGFHQSNINISSVWSRDEKNAEKLAKAIDSKPISSLSSIDQGNTDLVLICVTDDAIADVIPSIPDGIPVAYTSGSIRIDQLPKRDLLGVFYPLQTFSKDRKVELNKVPILLESENKEFGQSLFDLAKKISDHVIFADSKDRYELHIAAVMVNNFTNHLMTLAEEHLKSHEMDFSLLAPLIQETIDKMNDLSPKMAQTGPAKRGDQKVIENHLNSLEGKTKEIYKLLSESIKEKHKS